MRYNPFISPVRGKRWLLTWLALPLAFTLTSCVATTADLRQIADEIDAYQAGQITEEELSDAIDGKANEIEERIKRLPSQIPTSPIGWLQLLAGLGLTAAGTGVGVNQVRDRARRKRGEPVQEPQVKPINEQASPLAKPTL